MHKSTKPNVLNIAWMGRGDFGDEAMGYVHRQLSKSVGVKAISYYGIGPEKIYCGPNDIQWKTLHRKPPENRFVRLTDNYKLRHYKTVLIGGGSLFHSLNSIRWKLDVVKKIKKLRPSVFTAGIGISLGPFKDNAAELECATLLDAFDAAVFRDTASYEIAKSLSDNPNFFPSLDSTLHFLPIVGYPSDSNSKKEKKIGMSFVGKIDTTADITKSSAYLSGIALINKALSANLQVLLFTLYSGKDYRDAELHTLLRNNCSAPDKVDIHEFNGDVLETVKRMDTCSYFLSMRLHGIIFAYSLGIPFLSLAYNPKNGYFCDTIRYPKNLNLTLDTTGHHDEAIAALDQLIHTTYSEMNNGIMSLADARATVEKGFNYLVSNWVK